MAKDRRGKGLSRSVRKSVLNISTMNGPQNSRKAIPRADRRFLGIQGVAREQERTRAAVKQNLSGLSDSTVRTLADIQAQSTSQSETYIDIPEVDEDPSSVWEDLTDEMRGDEAFIHALRDIEASKWRTRWFQSTQSWRRRRERSTTHWEAVFPDLVDAYIRWKHSPPGSSITEDCPAAPGSEPAVEGPQFFPYTLDIFDIFSLDTTATIIRPANSMHPIVDLAANGYLGKTPVSPTHAVSFKTLELYYRIRQRKPSFSVEAFTKVLCDYYAIPFRRFMRTILAETFELYVRIINSVRTRVFDSLGWGAPNWRVKNACPACCYKLKDEPTLEFDRLWAFDGNNSLKRMRTVGGRATSDLRVFEDSDYFLSNTYVDRFANEVHGRIGKAPAVKGRATGDESDVSDTESEDEAHVSPPSGEGDPTDGEPDSTSTCINNWKSAAAESSKKMWAIFDESGVFVAACRHHFILWLADMVRSGELAKYPIAIVAKWLEVFGPESRALIGYDIGCGFDKTIRNTSLGDAFNESRSRVCVNAFHGYSHNYPCQLQHHPNVIRGVSLEDLETLERIFSSTNQLAPVVRYASSYRRRLFIDTYLQQWDDDKYANLATFIFNNYNQALNAVENDTIALNEAMASLHITDAELDEWEKEELSYFSTLGKEYDYDVHAVAYVELLQELRDLDNMRSNAFDRLLNSVPSNYTFVESAADATYSSQISSTRHSETERRRANIRYNHVENEISCLEFKMGISRRWTPTSPEYITTVKFIVERKYHRALNKLQKLVVQRLFELHKLNLAQTGYKLRTHLASALQTRCKTIQRAVKSYNIAAAALVPPRPPLDWTRVSKYGFLEEFTLLQDTRNDVRSKRWAEPAVRETIKLRRHLARAKEEIERCNVETRRLHTSIRDESKLFDAVLTCLESSSSAMLGPVREFVVHRRRVNDSLLRRIFDIYALPGFTGVRAAGVHIASEDEPMEEEPPVLPSDDQEGDDEDASSIIDDDAMQGDIGGLEQFYSNL